MVTLQGKSVFPDICIGKIVFWKRKEKETLRYTINDKAGELRRFAWAKEEAVKQLREMYRQTADKIGESNAAIFAIHEMLLADTEYYEAVEHRIDSQRVNLEYAIAVTAEAIAHRLRTAEDEYLRERAADVEDVSRRLLQILQGESGERPELEEPSIIAADDLTPSETVLLPADKVLGFILRKGSLSSHTAILARSMGIPAVVALGDGLGGQYDGEIGIIDGYHGILYIAPDEETRHRMEENRIKSRQHKNMLEALKGKENITLDGRRIKVFANAGNLADIDNACKNDAGGIGLFRSEMLYMEGQQAPTEEYQFSVYKEVLERMDGSEVVIRTLDIGADKQVPCVPMEKEENPAMGLRAIRLSLSRPELLQTQLRALYRAGVYGKLSIMYPMITSMEEVRRLRQWEERVKTELTAEGIPFSDKVPSGIMIETPAAALISEELAEEVDFFSVGTNDLIQYTLALDRQNSKLDEFYSPGHKAVVKLIEMTVQNAHKAGIRVGICGEMAADTDMTETFLRLGVDELSVAPGMILPLRKKIRELDLSR